MNRSFYGVRPLTTKDGFNTNAIFGFLNIMLKTIKDTAPDGVAVAFDLPAPTFRHKMYDAYKGTRKPSPPELHEQFPVIKELLRALGHTVLELEGYEADDIIARWQSGVRLPVKKRLSRPATVTAFSWWTTLTVQPGQDKGKHRLYT